nr:transporter substrate-binding domain-containing protein [Desulfobacterales bacterium]
MKTSRLFLTMLLMMFFLVACQTTQNQTTQNSVSAAAPQTHIDRILASGELRVGTSANQPPLNMKDRDGKIFGLEIDLAKILAKSMGVE